jgi:hypothetical protein
VKWGLRSEGVSSVLPSFRYLGTDCDIRVPVVREMKFPWFPGWGNAGEQAWREPAHAAGFIFIHPWQMGSKLLLLGGWTRVHLGGFPSHWRKNIKIELLDIR